MFLLEPKHVTARLAELMQPRDIKARRSAVFFQVVLLFCVNTVSKLLAFVALVVEECFRFNAT